MIRGGYWGGAWGLSWGGAWGEAWLLLNQPYQELSLNGQVFVRSYLTNIHSIEVTEQIVSVAAQNNISAIDSVTVVTAKSVSNDLVIARQSAETKPIAAPVASTFRQKKSIFPTVSVKRDIGLLAKAFEPSANVVSTTQVINIAWHETKAIYAMRGDQ